MRRALALVCLLATACDEEQAAPPKAPEPAPVAAAEPRFEAVWKQEALEHQFEALDVFVRDGWIYVAGGGANGKVSKVRVADGSVAWSVPGESYQPSYPVSNGRVVAFGQYYSGYTVGLDDTSGAERWKVPTQQAMSAACFAGDLVLCASHHRQFYGVYALDWRTGDIRWKAPLSERIRAAPVLHGDRALVGGHDGLLTALDLATGKPAWSLDCGGKIASSLFVAGDLAFVAVDDQRVEDKYETAKERKVLTVVDLKERKIVERLRSEAQWEPRFVASGGRVLFWDRTTLCAFDVAGRTVAYRLDAPRGLLPRPLVFGDTLVLGLQPQPICGVGMMLPNGEVRPVSIPVAHYALSAGTKRASFENGGLTTTGPHVAQVGDVVVLAGRPITALRHDTPKK